MNKIHRGMMVLAAVAALCSSSFIACAQTVDHPAQNQQLLPQQDSESGSSDAGKTGSEKPATASDVPKQSLSKQLSRSEGVLHPPPTGDKGVVPPPPVGAESTPVIPPPGTPGGDQNVQPK